ncbi:unnamed protein product [Brassicogethes aeneus]|uniref:Transcription factor 25 n=1 Tax=Brassicogethes aeneus TaxID=1431903 RepID=A0A9P0AT59_BRAAE|nr:unnamed protein product [Brassicogethes aeneus]
MSSRVLRKLQGDKELIDEISDTETDTPVSSGARKKQLNINRYDLLNQQSHSESEVKEDDNETEAAKSCEGENNHESVKRKKKKKKKKSGKHVNTQRSSEDNADIDEVERSVREVNRLLGENYIPKAATPTNIKHEKSTHRKNILSVQHKHLNPNNELKRIFGSKIIQSEHKRKNRGGGRGHVKPTLMVNCKENWPQVGKSGLSMSLVETKQGVQYFLFEHSTTYRQVQNKFLEAVESLNPDNIVAIINEHPYHVDALVQLSDLCKLSEDLAMAAELIERALYCLEYAFHPLFNVAQGNCRLDYRRQENRALFITVFKHLVFVGGRACCRTSLEFCKLLLLLDPDTDPVGVKLVIDYYALRAREHQWLIDFVAEWDSTKHLLQLPNFAYSLALAHFYIGDTGRADSLLQEALLMFPGVLIPLLEKCSVQIDNRVSNHPFFSNITDKKQPASLNTLIALYVNRSFHIWKDSDLLPWMEKNVHEALDRFERMDPVVADNELKRNKLFAGPLPRSISRHIILSDIKGVSPVTDDTSGPLMSFDPLPPKDSINLYTKPRRPTLLGNTSTNPLSIFFRSLLPNFTNNIPQNLLEQGLENDEARALPEGGEMQNESTGEMMRSVVSLVDAMRDLLNNIRPNDADVDENDDSADDDLT